MLGVVPRHERQAVDKERPRFEFDVFTCAGHGICALSVDLDGREGGRNLLNVPDEAG